MMRSTPVPTCLALCLAACLVAPVGAQTESDGAPRPPAIVEDARRAREYQEIAAEVAALQRQTALLKRVVRLVRPTVVHIEAKKRQPQVRYQDPKDQPTEAGSGVTIELGQNLYIVTNRHVIANAGLSDIVIKLSDGREMTPRAILHDRASDLALLTVADPSALVPARLGDSDRTEIGDFVLAVGSPFGLSHSVTYGIISAKGRRDLDVGANGVVYQDFLQTDAAINPGNSGGPLLNMRGEVVGINTAIFSSSGGNEGIGFSIPINMVHFVAKQLVEKGRVSRAYLGVHLDSKFDARGAARLGLARPQGARVSGITPDSPAARARLRVNDVILRFNDTPVEDDGHLINMVSTTSLGSQVTLSVLRDGQVEQVEVTVGQRSQFETEATIPRRAR